MTFRPDHELHRRRLGRNLGLGLVLLAFVVLVFGLTIVKVNRPPHMMDGTTLGGALHESVPAAEAPALVKPAGTSP